MASPYRPGEELVDKRTATSKTFTGDKPGEFRTEAYAAPVHFRDRGGRWADIDSSLAAPKDGKRKAKANAFTLELAERADADAVAQVGIDAEHSVGFSLEGATKAKGTADARSVTYAKVRPDTDLRLTSQRTGVKEELVLASPAAPDRFVFPLEAPRPHRVDRRRRRRRLPGQVRHRTGPHSPWLHDRCPGRHRLR